MVCLSANRRIVMVKVVASNQIAALVNDSATVYTCGFGLAGFPEEVAIKLKESYLATGHPRNLHLYFAACIGNTKNRGIHHFAPEGMVKRMVGGHFGVCGPDISRLISDNKVEAYNFPQGVLAGMPRNIAARRPELITKVGLGTFVDPRLQGGKITTQTTEDLVRLIELDGEEWLYYKAPKVDVALIRGTVADEHGNLTLDREGLILETISVAQAAKNCGGIVIAQVKRAVQYIGVGQVETGEMVIPVIPVYEYIPVDINIHARNDQVEVSVAVEVGKFSVTAVQSIQRFGGYLHLLE